MNRIAVERSIWIDVSPHRVWKAITDPQEFSLWFAPRSNWEITELKVGGTARFFNTPDDVVLHKIEELDPPHKFSLSWEEDGHPMLTTFRLEPENNGTRVTVTESGFEALAEEIRQKRADQTAKGYTESLSNLKSYLEGKQSDK